MALHLTGWRVSAGDELTVFDGNSCKIVAVSAGGMAGRTFKEAEEVARLIAAAPELLEALDGMLDGLPATENEYELVQAGLDPTEARKVAAAFAATRKARGDAA